jgi:ADP-ribose pyrophosphatase
MTDAETPAAAWRVLAERELFSAPPHLRLGVETVELPDGRRIDDYYQIRLRDFVNVFAETTCGRVLVLRQYKHGVRRIGLTFPGGHLEPGEAPAAAAGRELLEETGYQAAALRELGGFVTNANQRCSVGHLFLATGCRRVRPPAAGDLEEMELLLLTRAEVLEAAGRGAFPALDHFGLLAAATNPALMAAFETSERKE